MCFFYTNHGLLGIFVVRVPADAHHHLVDIPVTDTGPAIIYPCADICWKMVHHRVREVGWKWERDENQWEILKVWHYIYWPLANFSKYQHRPLKNPPWSTSSLSSSTNTIYSEGLLTVVKITLSRESQTICLVCNYIINTGDNFSRHFPLFMCSFLCVQSLRFSLNILRASFITHMIASDRGWNHYYGLTNGRTGSLWGLWQWQVFDLLNVHLHIVVRSLNDMTLPRTSGKQLLLHNIGSFFMSPPISPIFIHCPGERFGLE